MCECTDGADGTDGQRGDKGAEGAKGHAGVQGPIGLKGQEGSMGLMGVPGPCTAAAKSSFSASMIESFPEPNLPVPFPAVILNMPGHFNPLMGMYTAPINGTYVFTFNLAIRGKPLKVGLFRSFFSVIKVTEGTDRSTTSQTVVLHLSMGEMVWLQVKDDTTNGIFVSDESSSTFSGYLLHPDSCEMPRGRHHHVVQTFSPGDFGNVWGSSSTTQTPTPKP